MHRPPQRTPFTTTSIRSGMHPPAEYARMAHEALTVLGHPDGDVQLEPTLDKNDTAPCAVRISVYPVGVRIRHAIGAPSNPDAAWPTIMASAALSSDYALLKGTTVASAVALLAATSVSRVPGVRLRLACMSPGSRSALSLAFQGAVFGGTAQLLLRHSVAHADDLVVDALARSNLDGPLGVYLAHTMGNNVTYEAPLQVVPGHTGVVRFERMRKRLKQKWGLSAYDLVDEAADRLVNQP
ncbi:hypothetical protein psal_cds_662 [Pandoravirus salinus]|uniref:Uncharacterized protein n=1 Tax=Pandoravirus salinus TaxID=1349410 RepID=A0A291ATU8_9VIRU|nr:hypothetical protein psal_cds_662 [Pandoravirus salinus]ATE82208.1 hypothetical protein psal_cds_662 [Pandoravirus salinus]